MMTVKFNTKQSCMDFYKTIREQPDVLRAIKSGEKYKFNSKNKSNNNPLQLVDSQIFEIESDDECDFM